MSSEDGVYRVLIVDDDPAFLRLLAKYVADAGHEVLCALDGLEAMKLLSEHGPHMVITDWRMPRMDGLELCRAVRECEAVGFVYLIILTAQGERKRLVEAFEAGADDFLTKPVDRQEFLARLRAGRRMVKLQADLDHRNREVHLANAKMALAARELAAANKKLRILATTDELTGLLNRREAMDRLTQQWASSVRHGEPLSCIVLDIDHFKKFNDTHGHAVGDLVLRETAGAMRRLARTSEDVCRVGGEEFLIICPKSTASQAAAAAERFREAVASHATLHGDVKLTVTISLGVAGRTPVMESPDDLLRAADSALYTAKAEGRNRVRLAEELPIAPLA